MLFAAADIEEGPIMLDDVQLDLGARDVLVFRRIGRERWTHLGGVGRGQGWAGTIEVSGPLDRGLDSALAGERPVRRHGQHPHHVVGPYWAATSVVVRADRSHVVVLGSPRPSMQLLEADAERLQRYAAEAISRVTGVSPAKHLADELEVLNALRDFTATAPQSAEDLMGHLAQMAGEALSCDIAAVWLGEGHEAVADLGWRPTQGAQVMSEVAQRLVPQLAAGPDGPDWLVVQDATEQPLPEPVGANPEVASYLALPLDVDGNRGCLLVVHSAHAPQGFTALCQSLGAQLAHTGARLLEAALTHDELLRQLDSSREHATLDPLTGAANRRGWDEATARAQQLVDDGGSVTVVTVDIDGLKRVNDTHGHAAGDELIIECAQALRSCVRDEPDIIARVGGDEFALLLPGHDTDPGQIAARLRTSLEGRSTASGLPLRTSVGAATCSDGGLVADAVQRADAAMYDDKRARRPTP